MVVSSDAEKVDKLFNDVYIGDGKDNPPVTVRLDRLEQLVGKLSWIAGITLGAVITELVRSVVK